MRLMLAVTNPGGSGDVKLEVGILTETEVATWDGYCSDRVRFQIDQMRR